MPIEVKGDKVFVCPVPGREADVAAVRDLVEGLGGSLVCPKSETLDEFESCLEAADVVVIPLCPETLADPRVEALAVAASRAGRRVVGIWLGGCESEDVPPFLDRVGSAAVGMKADVVRKAVFGREPLWENPDGAERKPQVLPRKKKC